MPWPVERPLCGQRPASGCMSSKPMHLVRSRRRLRKSSPEDISMPVVEAACPTGGMKRTQCLSNGHDKSRHGWSPSPVPQSLDRWYV